MARHGFDVELLPRRIQCIIMIMYFLVVFVNCACGLTTKSKMVHWRLSNASLASDMMALMKKIGVIISGAVKIVH